MTMAHAFLLYPFLALALFVAAVWLIVSGIRRDGLDGALRLVVGGGCLVALGAWALSTQPPALERRVVRSVRNWKCPGNGKTVEENVVDYFTRAGRPPVRLDWSARLYEDLPFDWEVRGADCVVVLSEKLAEEHREPFGDRDAWSGNLPPGTAHLSFWPGSFFGGRVEGFDWSAVEACPGVEPEDLLLDSEKEDFYWKWARFGRDYSLSLVHPERFRWQKRNGFEADDRLSFEPESGVDPEFVQAALEVAEDRNDFVKCRAHAVRELLALPEPPDGLAAALERMADSPAEPSEWRKLCRGFLAPGTAEDESHAEAAEPAEAEPHAEAAEAAESPEDRVSSRSEGGSGEAEPPPSVAPPPAP